jgi:hypothetical protein
MAKTSPKTRRPRKRKKDAGAAAPDSDSKRFVPPDVLRALAEFRKNSREIEASIWRSING